MFLIRLIGCVNRLGDIMSLHDALGVKFSSFCALGVKFSSFCGHLLLYHATCGEGGITSCDALYKGLKMHKYALTWGGDNHTYSLALPLECGSSEV